MINTENLSYHELQADEIENFKSQYETTENFDKYMYIQFLRTHQYMTKNQMISKLNNIIDNYKCPKLEYEKALNILSNQEAKKNIYPTYIDTPKINPIPSTPLVYHPDDYDSYTTHTTSTAALGQICDPRTNICIDRENFMSGIYYKKHDSKAYIITIIVIILIILLNLS